MFDNPFDLSNQAFRELMIMFFVNLFFLFILVRLVYFRYSKKETYLFAFFLIGIIVFFISCLLNYIQLQWELAVGLVAIFSILRLRTRSITMKDMAYIFAVVGISVINSLRLLAFPLLGRFLINIIIIAAALILEEFISRTRLRPLKIIYENIDLLKPERKAELLADISVLTGKKIIRVKVDEIDYKKKSACITAYFHDRSTAEF